MLLRCSRAWRLSALLLFLATSTAQEYAQNNNNDYGDYDNNNNGGDSYQDYSDPYAQPDNLYADYAATKMEGAGAGAGTG